ncbi:amidase [Cupriavidus necator]|uniref:Amidase n=1 Tax=Cupriavidus necator TaxID=106590 RepID=A0A367PK41_CUPNE|nr:amidase [Cupriavidus necator]QQX82845.1 amidase [Cupriavidus necator]RCJ07415.1 amidase [Cupriavidus necator]
MNIVMHLADLSATDLLQSYANRDLSPVEVLDAVLARVAQLDPVVNAFRFVDTNGAREQARASEARWLRNAPCGLLDGVPVAFKDLLHVRGWPTRMGSLATGDGPQAEDCPAAARLREHGAVLLGKTNTSEFGAKGLTESRLAGITRNPWLTTHTPGGSSGGAAVATALGMAALHVASDGGGSIRGPAAACGVFGFKPSFGRVPCYPPAHSGTLFHLGPMARTVTDAALLLNVIGRRDVRDWHALPHEDRDWRAGLDGGVSGLRVAYSRTLGYVPVDPEVCAICDQAARRFSSLGAIVEDTDPGFDNPAPIFRTLWDAGVARLMRGIPADRLSLLDAALHESDARARNLDVSAYLEAMDRRRELGATLGKFHERYDLLLTPTLAAAAPKVSTTWSAPFCLPFNLTQQPAASVPCGFTQAGLPVALQIIGAAHADALVLRAARAFESTQHRSLPCPVHILNGDSDD